MADGSTKVGALNVPETTNQCLQCTQLLYNILLPLRLGQHGLEPPWYRARLWETTRLQLRIKRLAIEEYLEGIDGFERLGDAIEQVESSGMQPHIRGSVAHELERLSTHRSQDLFAKDEETNDSHLRQPHSTDAELYLGWWRVRTTLNFQARERLLQLNSSASELAVCVSAGTILDSQRVVHHLAGRLVVMSHHVEL